MYYYSNKFDMDIEDLILDFLMYRKSKSDLRTLSVLSETPKQPQYKNINLNTEIWEPKNKNDCGCGKTTDLKKPKSQEVAMPPMQNTMPPMQNTMPPGQNTMPPMQNTMPPGQNTMPPGQNTLPFTNPTSDFSDIDEREMNYAKQIYGEFARMLLPYVEEVLDEYDYEATPIYDDMLSRETLAQLVDKVLEKIIQTDPELLDISREAERGRFSRYKLLRSLTESIILHDLYVIRRPRFRRRRRNHIAF